MNSLKRVLVARPEVQGALIATLQVLSVFDVIQITQDQQSALTLGLVAWFGLAAKVAFGKDLEDLTS